MIRCKGFVYAQIHGYRWSVLRPIPMSRIHYYHSQMNLMVFCYHCSVAFYRCVPYVYRRRRRRQVAYHYTFVSVIFFCASFLWDECCYLATYIDRFAFFCFVAIQYSEESHKQQNQYRRRIKKCDICQCH